MKNNYWKYSSLRKKIIKIIKSTRSHRWVSSSCFGLEAEGESPSPVPAPCAASSQSPDPSPWAGEASTAWMPRESCPGEAREPFSPSPKRWAAGEAVTDSFLQGTFCEREREREKSCRNYPRSLSTLTRDCQFSHVRWQFFPLHSCLSPSSSKSKHAFSVGNKINLF